MNFAFTKMQALGNDFVIIDAISQKILLSPEKARLIADRHYGIGCDQILLVEKSAQKDADFYYRIINADGSEAEQCGNGARCFAKFVYDKGLTTKRNLHVATKNRILQLFLENDGQVTVDMGKPITDPKQIPFLISKESISSISTLHYQLSLPESTIDIGVISMGNPHAILQVPSVKDAPVLLLAPKIAQHSQFPHGVNVHFMEIVDSKNIRLRTYERGGIGETLACGSGACASVAIGRLWGLLDETVTVEALGGNLKISWPNQNGSIFMTGPATKVFDGSWTSV